MIRVSTKNLCRFVLNATCSAATACVFLLPTPSAEAVEVQMFFQATIEDVVDIESGSAQIGDVLEGTIVFETSTPESVMSPNNYPGAVTFFDIVYVYTSGPEAGGAFSTFSGSSGDAFVGPNEFSLGFTDFFEGNFTVDLQQGPAFTSLADAASILVAATAASPFNDALGQFFEPFVNSSFTFQNDFTFGNTFATFNFVEFTVVPEPASLTLLAIGGVCLMARRRLDA